MKEALMTFGRDTIDLTKHNMHFIADHWVGLAVGTAVFYAVCAGILYIDYRRLNAEINRELPFMDAEKNSEVEEL